MCAVGWRPGAALRDLVLVQRGQATRREFLGLIAGALAALALIVLGVMQGPAFG